MKTTIKEYAKAQGISIGTARRRLEMMVADGKATSGTMWQQADLPRASFGLTQPPPHRVNVYTINE